MPRCRHAVLFGLVLFTACGAKSKSSPIACVETFLSAIAADDKAGAMACLVATERNEQGLSFDKKGVANGWKLGATTIDGDRATVKADLGEHELPLCLRREGDGWRISMHETMRAAIGMGPEDLEKAMQKAAQDMADQMQKAMGEAERQPAMPNGR